MYSSFLSQEIIPSLSNSLMMRLFKLLTGFSLMWFLFIQSDCKQTNPSSTPASSSYPLQHTFLNIDEGQARIASDSKELYFDRVNELDISLQMGKELVSENREALIESFKDHLRRSVLDFSKDEQSRLNLLFEQIKGSFNKFNIKTYHKHIYLSKIDDSVYGKQAFFTREDVIFIPEHQLGMDDDALKSIILHEIFHIYSRYDDALKSNAYGLIGFTKLPKPYKVSNPKLKQRLLLNPDGLDNSYGIELTDDKNNSLTCVAVLHSRFKGLNSDLDDYFSYIHFELYKYDKDKALAISDDELQNDIPAEYFNSFFDQISDNTQYIIHPDEIMADNFMLMINAYESQNFDHFSESGTRIVHKLHELMSNVNN